MPDDDNPYLDDSNLIVVGGQKLPPPQGVNVKNFLDPSVYRFHNQSRTGPVNELVIHETVTRSWPSTVAVLKPATKDNPGGRGLGVHFIADSDGTIYQHGDLATDFLWHASQHNPVSVGIETVNPYEPQLAPKDGPWKDVIDAPWAAGGRYLVPTPEQSESVCQMVSWLTSGHGLSIPMKWAGLSGATLAMGPLTSAKSLAPGVYAHHYFGHADGCWLVLYSWLRLVGGLEPADARAAAIKLATGAHAGGVDVSQYVPAPDPDPEATQT